MSYTPGPWCVRDRGQHGNNPDLARLEICYGDSDECICDTVYETADARLISAAPELLEALQLARRYGSQGETEDGQSVSYFIDKAIAKATGQS